MLTQALAFFAEDASDDDAIEFINAEAFGPGRHVRAAARIREQGPHDRALSFVCRDGRTVIGSVRMTPVLAGRVAGHLLGPLAVRPSYKSRGIGGELVRMALAAARNRGSEAVILVGDPPYYSRFGFERVAYNALDFPGPVDPGRVMAVPFRDDVHGRLAGTIGWRPCHNSVN